jgi:hypothetical protein
LGANGAAILSEAFRSGEGNTCSGDCGATSLSAGGASIDAIVHCAGSSAASAASTASSAAATDVSSCVGNSTLRVLRLAQCQLGDRGVVSLCDAIISGVCQMRQSNTKNVDILSTIYFLKQTQLNSYRSRLESQRYFRNLSKH